MALTRNRTPNPGNPIVGKIIAIALIVFLILIITACGTAPSPDEVHHSNSWFTEIDEGTGTTLRCQVQNANNHRYNKTCYVLTP